MNKICKLYISKVKAFMPIMGREERKYIESLRLNIEDCYADISSMDELYEEMGSPEEVVRLYYAKVDTDEMVKRIRRTRYVKCLIFTIIVCLLIATTVFSIALYKEFQVFKSETLYSSETIID